MPTPTPLAHYSHAMNPIDNHIESVQKPCIKALKCIQYVTSRFLRARLGAPPVRIFARRSCHHKFDTDHFSRQLRVYAESILSF